MFRIRLVMVRTDAGLVFRVGRSFRVVSALAALALVAMGLILDTYLVPGVLAALALVGALYEESARFDRNAGRAEFRVGLTVLHRTRSVTLAEIAEVRLSTFGPALFTSFEVGTRDGRTMTIENDRGKASTERLTAWAAELASWLGVPLVH